VLTLSSQRALAIVGQKACTVSTWASAHPSAQVSTPCGDSPGCWKNHDFAAWADGAVFKQIPVQYTHSTTITSVFSILASSPFKCAQATLANLIGATGTSASVTVQLANGTIVNVWSPGQQLNVVAALLNNFFYGNLFYPLDIQSVIASTLAAMKSSAANNDQSGISNQADSLDNLLNQLNNQGETCAV
jgi:hypothetical protein